MQSSRTKNITWEHTKYVFSMGIHQRLFAKNFLISLVKSCAVCWPSLPWMMKVTKSWIARRYLPMLSLLFQKSSVLFIIPLNTTTSTYFIKTLKRVKLKTTTIKIKIWLSMKKDQLKNDALLAINLLCLKLLCFSNKQALYDSLSRKAFIWHNVSLNCNWKFFGNFFCTSNYTL